MTFRPLRDQILVQPDELQSITGSSLIIKAREGIHDSQAQLGRTGTVIAVGPGKLTAKGQRIPMQAKPGDRIAFGEFQYPEYHEDNTRYLILQDADVAMVFESEIAA